MKEGIKEKSFAMAVRIVRLYQYLGETKREYVLSKQLLRSGTSVGANVAEAQSAQSKADFIAKMSIAVKEARETDYWLRLLIETEYLDGASSHVQSLLDENLQLVKILVSIVKTTQTNLNK